ncbi:hypothetical protein [Pseudoroseomonas cervicalis]|uniref:hypothetical protein n=1 Tax=Teichococcus cervicalis TaxID=204525 RepID=UPI0022F15550|nr:hypothetical protein [Pseudoroseomonas cervicalis]WBV41596.1 hypothetical protein PFY06_10090 [Pseudoroseomonas cervicalis]
MISAWGALSPIRSTARSHPASTVAEGTPPACLPGAREAGQGLGQAVLWIPAQDGLGIRQGLGGTRRPEANEGALEQGEIIGCITSRGRFGQGAQVTKLLQHVSGSASTFGLGCGALVKRI